MPKVKTENKSKYYTSPKYGIVYINNEALSTPTVRLCWPYLSKPREGMLDDDGKKGPDKYEVTLVLPKKDPEVNKLVKAVELMTKPMIEAANKWRKKKGLARIGECDAFKDGDEQDLEKNPQYKGCWIMTARKSVTDNDASPPNLISIKKDKKTGKFERLEAKQFPGGVLVRAIVTPLVSGSGISYKIITLQLIKDDGKRFGGGGAPAPESYNHMLEGGLDEDDSDDTEESEDSEDDSAGDDEDSDDSDDEDSEEDSDDDEEESEDEDESESEDDDNDSDDDSDDEDSEDDDENEEDEDDDDTEDEDESEEDEKPARAAKGKRAARGSKSLGKAGKPGKKSGRQLALDRL